MRHRFLVAGEQQEGERQGEESGVSRVGFPRESHRGEQDERKERDRLPQGPEVPKEQEARAAPGHGADQGRPPGETQRSEGEEAAQAGHREAEPGDQAGLVLDRHQQGQQVDGRIGCRLAEPGERLARAAERIPQRPLAQVEGVAHRRAPGQDLGKRIVVDPGARRLVAEQLPVSFEWFVPVGAIDRAQGSAGRERRTHEDERHQDQDRGIAPAHAAPEPESARREGRGRQEIHDEGPARHVFHLRWGLLQFRCRVYGAQAGVV